MTDVTPRPKSTGKRKRRNDLELAAAREEVFARSNHGCEIGSPVCIAWAQVVHHTAGRGFAGCHDPSLLLAACNPCHGYLHANPAESYERGWMVKRTVRVR